MQLEILKCVPRTHIRTDRRVVQNSYLDVNVLCDHIHLFNDVFCKKYHDPFEHNIFFFLFRFFSFDLLVAREWLGSTKKHLNLL